MFRASLGASGLRMQYEVYKQLQGKAGDRQVRDPRLGLIHNRNKLLTPWINARDFDRVDASGINLGST